MIKTIFILQDDQVYMKNEKERQEYVEADSGFILTGAPLAWSSSIPWKYGQYEKNILDIALNVLEVPLESRNDALAISKNLAHGVKIS